MTVNEERCPICEHSLNECQCYYGQANYLRAEVCYEHLYLFSKAQINHIIKLQKFKQISYSDAARSKALEDVKKFTTGRIPEIYSGEKESTVPGTSCLIRIHKPSKFIKIAYRKNNKNYPDCVCISNKDREEFFADAKANNAQARRGVRYILEEGDNTYQKWSDFIDNEYNNA